VEARQGKGVLLRLPVGKDPLVLDLILFLVKLPFILIGAVVSVVSSLAGLAFGLAGGMLGALWSLFVPTLFVLLVVWLVVAVLRRRRVKMA
jgi:hypothetical protein